MARTYEETIFDATVDAVNDALAQPVLPTPDEIKGNILDNSRNEVTMYNSIAQQGAKWKVPVELETYQIAYIMLRVHYIALIETTESEDDADCSLLGVYMEDGEDEGMVNRCAADRALDQMGIKKSVYKDKQISELHERFKNIVEEEMKSDAYEFGYEPIHRKAPTGEKKVHLPVEIYRDVVAQQQANAEKSEQQFLQQIVLEADKENFENEKRDAEISMMIEQAQNEYAMDSVFEIQQEEMKKEQERQQAELRKKENLVASQMSANKTEAESLKRERKNIDADKKSVAEQKLDMNLKEQDLDTKIQNYKDGIERIQQFSVQLPEQQVPANFIEFAKSFNRKVPVFEKDALGNRQYKRNADGKIVTRDESCYESYCAVQKRHRDLQNQSEDFLEKEKQHGFGFVD